MKKPLKFYWHIHHDILLEPLTEPLKNRIKFIKKNKPKDEHELRLKLIKPVKGKLPAGFVKAWDKYYEAKDKYWEARDKYYEALDKYNEALDKYNEARDKYYEALDKYQPQLKKLHEKECGCGWSFTRETIFTKRNGLEK